MRRAGTVSKSQKKKNKKKNAANKIQGADKVNGTSEASHAEDHDEDAEDEDEHPVRTTMSWIASGAGD
jgi:type II secretory ATPase GspE/PulE/Tfp pilus assembly ATPase PilB-like protein